MASKRISELPAATALDGSEQIPLTQAGETRRIPSDTYQLFDIIDVTLDPNDAATNDQRISDALTRATAGRPTKIRLRCNPDQPGRGPIATAITITDPNHILYAEGHGTSGGGARLVWEGAAGATMVTVDGPGIWLVNVALDAADLAAACVQYNSGERQGYRNLTCERFTGQGVTIGDGTANNNAFVGDGYLNLRGMGGSTPLVTNASATEDIHLVTVNIAPHSSATSALARAWYNDVGNTTVEELTIDDSGMAGYAVRVRGGSIRVWSWSSEVAQPLTFDTTAGGRGNAILTGEMRSCSPQTGEYAVEFAGSPTGTQKTLLLGGVKITTGSGATVAPDVFVQNATLFATGVTFDNVTDGDPIGSVAPDSTGRVVALTDGLDLYGIALRSPEGGGALANVINPLPANDQLRLGENRWGETWAMAGTAVKAYVSNTERLAVTSTGARAAGVAASAADITANRPSASAVGAGAMWFDTDLGKPIWSNGTDWVDATGTVV